MNTNIQAPADQPAEWINEAGVRVFGDRVVVGDRAYFLRSIGGIEVIKAESDIREDFRRIMRSLLFFLLCYLLMGAAGGVGALIGAGISELASAFGPKKLSLSIIVQGERVELLRVIDTSQGTRIANAILHAASVITRT